MKTAIHTTINSNIKFKIQLNKTLLKSYKFIKILKIVIEEVSFIN